MCVDICFPLSSICFLCAFPFFRALGTGAWLWRNTLHNLHINHRCCVCCGGCRSPAPCAPPYYTLQLDSNFNFLQVFFLGFCVRAICGRTRRLKRSQPQISWLDCRRARATKTTANGTTPIESNSRRTAEIGFAGSSRANKMAGGEKRRFFALCQCLRAVQLALISIRFINRSNIPTIDIWTTLENVKEINDFCSVCVKSVSLPFLVAYVRCCPVHSPITLRA